MDSFSGLTISSGRFWLSTDWSPDDLKDQWVLDVGCGAGRFAEVALLAGAKLGALNYSIAVDACYANLKHHPNLHVVQGDIYALPFAQGAFPFVYSLGVLQHTPDVANAFAVLTLMVRGALVHGILLKRFRTMLHPKYLLRPFTKRIEQPQLFSLLQRLVHIMFDVSQTLGRVPLLRRVLKRLAPVADYTDDYALTDQQLTEWALLDTFDMLAPAYDSPQTVATARRWFEEAKFVNIQVGHWGHLVARGTKLK